MHVFLHIYKPGVGLMFFNEIYSAYQGCIYLIKNSNIAKYY